MSRYRAILFAVLTTIAMLVGTSSALGAEAVLTGPPTLKVRVGSSLTDRYASVFSERTTIISFVTIEITGTAPCTIVEGPVDPAANEATLLYVDEGRMKKIVLPNLCDSVGSATLIYEVGETWNETQAFYELGGVNIYVARKKLNRTYPIRLTWGGAVVQPLRFLKVSRSGFRKGFRREIFDTDFDPYVNICINGGLKLRARGGHLYCVYQRSDSVLVKARVS